MDIDEDANELSSQMRNAMMIFVAKFLFMVLPPLIAVFFYILTMTKNDVQITVDNKIAEIEQTYKNKIAEMKTLHDRMKACKKDCNKKNLELKISEKRTVSDRFKMNFNVDKKKVEFRFEEVK
ncbi:MAG: hypothetical protein V3U88_08660 [Methylococcales bacterium]